VNGITNNDGFFASVPKLNGT